MTDKEFVQSIYPEATYIENRSKNGLTEGYITYLDSRVVGWNRGHSETWTWYYARKDIELEMLCKLGR